MSWLQKLLPPRIKSTPAGARSAVPEGLWIKCPACEAVLYRTDLENNLYVCPKCATTRASPRASGSTSCSTPRAASRSAPKCVPVDSLKFKDTKKYPDRLAAALEETGETDALVVMQGSIKSVPLVLAAFEFEFMGGSMGSVVGERFVRGVRVAYENRVPFVCIAASGGARMQEGVNSLFQMAKTTAVLQELTQGAAAVHLDADRSDDGRRVGVVRLRRRRGDRRARRADRLRRPARHRADGARDAARGLPARRVPAREGRDRHDRRPPPAARRTRAAARAADRGSRRPPT